jgi:hypothetical protein
MLDTHAECQQLAFDREAVLAKLLGAVRRSAY